MISSRRRFGTPRRPISAMSWGRNARVGPSRRSSRSGSSQRQWAEAMMLHRHDLLWAEPSAWDAVLGCYPGLTDLPLVADWARLDRPVIVRRRMARDCVGGVPAALPLPPNCGKRRLAFSFASGAAVVALPPEVSPS
jgi:hypothetical protein